MTVSEQRRENGGMSALRYIAIVAITFGVLVGFGQIWVATHGGGNRIDGVGRSGDRPLQGANDNGERPGFDGGLGDFYGARYDLGWEGEDMADWTVTGAGDDSYNGDYTEAGTHNEKPYYTHGEGAGTRYLYWDGAAWLLQDSINPGENPAYYGTGDDLPASPWTAWEGTPPAPEVSGAGHSVSGTAWVWDDPDWLPVWAATIIISDGEEFYETDLTKEDGSDLIEGVPDGEYQVSGHLGVQSLGCAKSPITMAGEDLTEIDLILVPLAPYTGELQSSYSRGRAESGELDSSYSAGDPSSTAVVAAGNLRAGYSIGEGGSHKAGYSVGEGGELRSAMSIGVAGKHEAGYSVGVGGKHRASYSRGPEHALDGQLRCSRSVGQNMEGSHEAGYSIGEQASGRHRASYSIGEHAEGSHEAAYSIGEGVPEKGHISVVEVLMRAGQIVG